MNESEKYLKQIADLLYDAIYDQLNVKYRSQGYYGGFKRGNSPRIASRSMINSLKVEVVTDFEGGNPLIVATFDTDPEFLPEMIDQGRKPGPVSLLGQRKLEDWIRQKPILWRNERGRFVRQSMKSKVFLISRSIREKGYKGINFFQKAQNQVQDELVLKGEEAAAAYFQFLIDQQLVQLL
jgi:hypothetical protein